MLQHQVIFLNLLISSKYDLENWWQIPTIYFILTWTTLVTMLDSTKFLFRWVSSVLPILANLTIDKSKDPPPRKWITSIQNIQKKTVSLTIITKQHMMKENLKIILKPFTK